MTLATKLSSFFPPCGDKWQSRTVLRNSTMTGRLRRTACWSKAWVCKPHKKWCVCSGRSWSRSSGAWAVATDPKLAQTQAGALQSQPGSYSLAPAGSVGVRQYAGAPFAAPRTVSKKLNKDFSSRAGSLVSLQEHTSFLSVTHLSLKDKEITEAPILEQNTDMLKKHIDKPSFSFLHEFGDSENMSSGKKVLWLVSSFKKKIIASLTATEFSPNSALSLSQAICIFLRHWAVHCTSIRLKARSINTTNNTNWNLGTASLYSHSVSNWQTLIVSQCFSWNSKIPDALTGKTISTCVPRETQ